MLLISSDLTWNQHILFINGNHTGPLGCSVVLLALATLLVQRKKIHHSHEINKKILKASIWHPHLKRKFCLIGKDSKKSYKIYPRRFFFRLQVHLTCLQILPLIKALEINDNIILLLIKFLKNPSDHFNI